MTSSCGRSRGLRVVRLTGEAAVDTELIRSADVWVATTEKFEAICRAGSLRDSLAEVGCLVVDEIHLLGDPTRGAVLEALLARVREDSAGTRIVGLSATVANAEEVARWLGARLVRTTWRPTRLTWQLPLLDPVDETDWVARAAVRTGATVRIARQVTDDGGSVLVFCGSKRRVRSTALALAADRGVSTVGVDADDAEAVERLCTGAGVRLHYRDLPYKREAEQAFRAREADVLVATSTVAAGVNLPARAVIVSDTTLGMDRVEVSMVQQMFGRAGRIGAGEREGWAFLLTDPAERAHWQARLAAGYTVRSRLADHVADHLLAEAVQQRLATLEEAESWWAGTFAAYQGHDSVEPLHEAAKFLASVGCLRPAADEDLLEPSALGRLTSRFMVDAVLADDLATALRLAPVPDDPLAAEDLLAELLSTCLPVLEQAPFTERAKAALRAALRETGRAAAEEPDTPWGPARAEAPPSAEDEQAPRAGDLARAVLLLAAHRPATLPRPSRVRPGHPRGLHDRHPGGGPRYLAWLGAQGPSARSTPGWPSSPPTSPSVCAGAPGGRPRSRTPPLDVRAHGHGPARARPRPPYAEGGPGARHRRARLERHYAAGRLRHLPGRLPRPPGGAGHRNPHRPPGRRSPRLGPARGGDPPVSGAATTLHIADGEETTLLLPPAGQAGAGDGCRGAAVFTRGDRLASGWLEAYAATSA